MTSLLTHTLLYMYLYICGHEDADGKILNFSEWERMINFPKLSTFFALLITIVFIYQPVSCTEVLQNACFLL